MVLSIREKYTCGSRVSGRYDIDFVPDISNGIHSHSTNIGGYFSFGARVTDYMSSGISAMGWYSTVGEVKDKVFIVGGVSAKIHQFDVSGNITCREKPARLITGAKVKDLKLLIGVEFSPELLAR